MVLGLWIWGWCSHSNSFAFPEAVPSCCLVCEKEIIECRDSTPAQSLTLNTCLNVTSLPIPKLQAPLAASPIKEKILNPRAGLAKVEVRAGNGVVVEDEQGCYEAHSENVIGAVRGRMNQCHLE